MSELHERVRDWWDADADAYDASAGHAMSDPVEAAAWSAVLAALLPPAPAAVLDVGTGTGSISLAAAEMGHAVTAIDLSEQMLAKARAKAGERALAVRFEHRPAEDPPGGPFDAIVERHVLWTLPDPVAALGAWRGSARTGGRLVSFEGSWGGEGPFVPLKNAAAARIERWHGIPDDHHAPYPEAIVSNMPLAGVGSPKPFIEAVREAGWRSIRLYRLRDVEWAIARRQPWPLGWLTHRPRYAIVATA